MRQDEPRRRFSLATHITVLVSAIVALAVAAASVGAFFTVRHQLLSQLDERLVERARAAATSPLADPAALTTIPAEALGAADVKIALLRADGVGNSARGVASSPPLGDPELAVARDQDAVSLRSTTDRATGEDVRVVAVPAGRSGDGVPVALVLSQSLEPSHRTLTHLGTVLAIFGLAGVAGSALLGWAVARGGLRPVRRLTAAAERVARTEELDPIEVSGADEVARLAVAFNAMLMALEHSRDRQRRLVADAGHELRTPLTSLRTNLDLLAQADDRMGAAVREELLNDVRAQVEELTTLVQDLVELARDEPLASSVEQIDLADVVDKAATRVRRRAPGLDLAVTTQPWFVVGEPQALERAVTNLLDNAAKWSPPLGQVEVRLVDGVLTVADEGPGIAEEDLPYVFERFYRASDARGMPGSGLGLAIVRQAVERHGGVVKVVDSERRGTVIEIRLPGVSSASLGGLSVTSQVSG